MSKAQQIRDAINLLPVARQVSLPAEPNSVAMRVMIGEQAKKLGVSVKSWTKNNKVFIVRID
jgi:hypothetical protein